MKTVDSDLKQFSLPSTYILSGKTMSGKTEWVKKLLLHNEEMFTEKIHSIIYVYSVWQPAYTELESSLQDMIQFRTDVPTMDEIQEKSKSGTLHTLLILDDKVDLFTKGKISDEIVKLVTIGAHHLLCSCIFLTYTLFKGTQASRDIATNSDDLILFKNARSAGQIRTLAHQMLPKSSEVIVQAFNIATHNKYGYLVIAMNEDWPYKLKTNIFPNEMTEVFIPSIPDSS